MSCESKIYIVEKNNNDIKGNCGKLWCQIIAMIDMCKMESDFKKIFRKETDCYFYADDSNTEIFEDRYGEPLKECSLKDVENYVQAKIEHGGSYRRYWPLLCLVRSFDSPQWKKERLAVLHYGY